jgi:glutathione peroxidase
MFSKVDVNGENAHPLYKYLKKEKSGIFGSGIKWNFTKFLIDKNGNPVKRYAPTTKPEKIEKDLKKLL